VIAIISILLVGGSVVWSLGLQAPLAQSERKPEPENKPAQFIGRWINADPQQVHLRDAITRLEIHKNDGLLFVRAWGRCRPTDCDWGEESVEIPAVEDGEFVLTWRSETGAAQYKLSLAGDQLRIDGQTRYLDNFGNRSPYVAHFLKHGSPSPPQSLMAAPPGVRSASSSIGLVMREDVPGKIVAVASGFFIASDIIVTSSEAVRNAQKITLRLPGHETAYNLAEVQHANSDKNIAMLKVAGVTGWPLPISQGVIAGGIDVYVVSNSQGKETSFTRGIVNNTSDPVSADHIEITAPVLPLDVGAPVLNRRGEVISILTTAEEGARTFQAVRIGSVLGSAGQLRVVSSAGVTRPVMISVEKPSYTEKARDNRVKGNVVMRVLVGADGTVKDVRIVRGLPDGLNEEAIKSMYKARFKPATRNGQPIEFWITTEATFNLR
jgi:TonB family protein